MEKWEKFLKKKGIEDTSKLEAEKLAELYNEYNAEVEKELNEKIEAKASKEDIQALKDEIKANIDKQLLQLNNILKDQGIALKKVLAKDGERTEKSILDNLKENADKLKSLKEGDKSARITFKAAGSMSLDGNVTGQVPQAERLPGLNTVASRQVRFLDVVTRGTVSSNLIEWVYQANKDGTAGATAEGAAKKQIDFDLVVASQRVEKYTAYIKVTDEMLDDVDFMASEINNELMRELLKSVEAGAFEGNGTTPNMNGVKTVATAFAAGTFAGTIDNANIVDVLTVAVNQIMIAEQPMPNAIWMHPSDVTALKMVKVSATDKRYVERLANVGGQLSLDGIPIYPTTLVTQDEYLIGDFTKAFVLNKQGVTIEVGYDSDDFTKNFKTVRAEWRGVTFVKNNDRTAFVTGDFTTDKAALETA